MPVYIPNNKLKTFCIDNLLWKVKSNNELKDIDIDNCICYCFNDIMRVVGIDFDDILLN